MIKILNSFFFFKLCRLCFTNSVKSYTDTIKFKLKFQMHKLKCFIIIILFIICICFYKDWENRYEISSEISKAKNYAWQCLFDDSIISPSQSKAMNHLSPSKETPTPFPIRGNLCFNHVYKTHAKLHRHWCISHFKRNEHGRISPIFAN